ncbi:cold shock domain-containing protein [Lysobacter sp. GCM10012299]|jgi:cold shock CspA family protein|uniref:cold shock domain-containing protein n=1 Tax=Lysobacter sp. GCM10012299 TaxID=3317333 RepID=UPI00360A7A1C
MRTHGTLSKWNDDRGFGFITPAQGSDGIFVHISSFPPGGPRPTVGELISFETQAGPDGKTRAIRVMRPGVSGKRPQRHRAPPARRRISLAGVVTAAAIAAIAMYGYREFNKPAPVDRVVEPAAHVVATPPVASFKCDGRTTCSQMTSCAEATYFLQHCPNTTMDGNGDGEPCEKQWCN